LAQPDENKRRTPEEKRMFGAHFGACTPQMEAREEPRGDLRDFRSGSLESLHNVQ
jgi:hypothetical protein